MVRGGQQRRMADIIAYWHAVEMFDPRAIPRPARRREALKREPGTGVVERIQIMKGRPLPPLPWETGHPRYGESPESRKYGSVWRHTVYGGLYSFQTVREALAARLGYVPDEDYDGVADAESALFAFTVDENGIPLDNTEAFSSAAWATGRLHSPGLGAPGWLDGFGETTRECTTAFYRLLSKPVSYLTAAGNARSANGWRNAITDIFGSAAAGAVGGLITALAPVLGGPAGAGALAGVAAAVLDKGTKRAERPADAEPSEPVPEPACRRRLQVLDVVAFAAHVAGILSVPPGLGDPAALTVVSTPVGIRKDGTIPDTEPAFLSSAVLPDLDLIRHETDLSPALTAYLSEAPVGRTDLHEDRRAVLDMLDPDAFPLARWPAGRGKPLAAGQQFAVNAIVAELAHGGLFAVNGPPGTGKTTLLRDLIASIVVERASALAELASPEQAFAEPLERGSPGAKRRVVSPRRELTGYEIVVASSNNAAVENITRELPAAGAIDPKCKARYFPQQATRFLGSDGWGMVAAPLGNAEKRKHFREKFFWNADGMHDLLQELERKPPPLSEWRAAVDRFKQAREKAALLRAERAGFHAAASRPVSAAEFSRARMEADRLRRDTKDAQAACDVARVAANGLEHAVSGLRIELDLHVRSRPGPLRSVVCGAGQRPAWLARDTELRERLADLQAKLSAELSVAARRAREAEESRARARDKARDIERLAERERLASDGAEKWGAAFPQDWLGMPRSDQERSAPWSDPDWTEARTEVFLAALDLHRALVTGAAKVIRTNLLRLFDALNSDPGAPAPDAELAAWQTLFLVVPVISTTFASCGRIFGALGGGTLGWVLIDEAGQAVPQHAVGALWRARRAVVVGDPLQLEPISQVPPQVAEKLRVRYRVNERWLPTSDSTQTLADRRNRWGTTMMVSRRDGETVPTWVGAPLLVHRRCEEPMFSVSNAIAYHGRMVHEAEHKPFPGGEHGIYPGSSWVDVTGPADGRWVPAQGEALARILARLHEEFGVSFEDIYVLSLFRDVRSGCRQTVRARFPAGKDLDEFVEKNIGTVHTMQGKEADAVIFVLGTDRSPSGRARDWAARPVNLLNVAVSRARRRLFVIGSHEEWRDVPNFATLARDLHRHRWNNGA